MTKSRRMSRSSREVTTWSRRANIKEVQRKLPRSSPKTPVVMRVEAKDVRVVASCISFQRAGGRERRREGENVERSLIVRTTRVSQLWSLHGLREVLTRKEEEAKELGVESEKSDNELATECFKSELCTLSPGAPS